MTNKNQDEKYCNCGFPQSYPIPHEHDRTERENQIIAAKDKEIAELKASIIKLDELFKQRGRELENEFTENAKLNAENEKLKREHLSDLIEVSKVHPCKHWVWVNAKIQRLKKSLNLGEEKIN